MKQKTSVQWLIKNVNENIPPLYIPEQVVIQAKEMHKVDCLSFAEEWEIRCNEKNMDSKEQLYDEIYKTYNK